MSVFESAGRLGAALVAMVQTRVELASVELQEEAQRMLRYLLNADVNSGNDIPAILRFNFRAFNRHPNTTGNLMI